MMDQRIVQDRLFYAFNLENHVPRDHLLRGVDHFLDLGDLRQHLAQFYSHTGRPSIDPELMILMLVIGYCMGIRYERRLCEKVHLNLAYRWFCHLGLEDMVPDQGRRRQQFAVSLALRSREDAGRASLYICSPLGRRFHTGALVAHLVIGLQHVIALRP
jgi:transposase